MAKKKRKSHGTKRRRSHRMGAVNLKSIGTKILGIGAAAFVDNVARKNLTMDTKLIGAIEIAGGVFLPKFMKGNLGEGLSDGLMAVGTINLLKGFSIISGIGAVPARVPLRRGAISPSQPAIGAAGRPFLDQNVGSMMPADMQEMAMGALFLEE